MLLIVATVRFTKLLTNCFRSSFEIPKFATKLAISLRSCQSNRELQNEVVNFSPNFVGKLRSSSRAKFAPFGVVGLVIKLQMNLNKVKTFLNKQGLFDDVYF